MFKLRLYLVEKPFRGFKFWGFTRHGVQQGYTLDRRHIYMTCYNLKFYMFGVNLSIGGKESAHIH